MSRPPTSDQIRDRIDHGEEADKVDFPDPSAAPLGTDAEAGGHPPSPEERARAEQKIAQSEADRAPGTGARRPTSAPPHEAAQPGAAVEGPGAGASHRARGLVLAGAAILVLLLLGALVLGG